MRRNEINTQLQTGHNNQMALNVHRPKGSPTSIRGFIHGRKDNAVPHGCKRGHLKRK